MRPSPLQTQARAARFAARGWRVLTASALLVGLLACRSVHEPADTAAPAPAPADGGIWVASALRGPVEALADARRRAAPALPRHMSMTGG